MEDRCIDGSNWLMLDKVQRMNEMLEQFPILGFGDTALMHLVNPEQAIAFVTFCVTERVQSEREQAIDVGERLVERVGRMVRDAQDAGATMYCRRSPPRFVIGCFGDDIFVRVWFRGLFLRKYPGRAASMVIVGSEKPEGEIAPVSN